MTHLGYYHDDTLYWVSAQSLAQGHGYRIASLPGEPFQTKYPPLYPALLALVWKTVPNFPGNLPLAALVSWLLVPLYIAMIWVFLREYGFKDRELGFLTIAAALSPMTALFGVTLMPELLFMVLLLSSIVLAERAEQSPEAWRLAVAAGICGGLAYLSKSIAMPLLFTAPFCFGLRKQWRNAALFFAAMAPCVAGWQLWVAAHMSKSWDLVTLYYTNYVGMQFYNVPLRDLPLYIFHNIDGFLMGGGKVLIFDMPFGSIHLERVLTVAAIVGCVRLARRNRKLQYPLVGAGMTAILLVWHYPPDQRFVFPLYPLLLAGLWTELANVWKALRASLQKPAQSDRVAARVGAAVFAVLALFVAFTNFYGLFAFVPGVFAVHGADFEARLPAYEWIATHAPQNAAVFAYDDPLLYLYTGRKSCGMPIPTKFSYHGDDAGLDRLLHTIPDFARQYRLDYVLLTINDFYRDLGDNGAKHLRESVESSGAFTPSYRAGVASIYRYTGGDNSQVAVR